ncbi:dihydroorotate oxidase [Agrilactobacillus fermenti]|uniref:dihydroorotate oxidase n=1 Tax=Agrilactobacillus fermenti TaxID=2586909 RepID=UPI0022A9BCCD|nr:dihydroorotate oxidase [Agrilactobacillus fermenti]MCD2256106.1 dihydroorotate oxidase [Agrilactobacillus fermenti]
MVNLTTSLHNYTFQNPLMNASGVHCYTTEQLDELLASDAGTLVTKSATTEYRQGNPEPRYRNLALGSINSMGLPNEGLKYYLDYVLGKQTDAQVPPLFLSVAGLSMAEDLEMLAQIEKTDFNGLTELNLSCPNVPGKPQVAYDFEATEKMLDEAFSIFHKPLGVKLPPYFDLAQFDIMANILNKYPLAYINTINSVGNGLYIDVDSETVAIKPKGGFGGLGGAYILPTALANVHAFRQRLNPEIAIIGTGGVQNGADVFAHILAGADMVQVGTQLAKDGPAVFTRLTQELTNLMTEKNYQTLADFRGKVKTL